MENRTLNQITGKSSNGATNESSYLVGRVEQLHDIPISEFEVEDYRVLINQGIALKYIVPSAIDILSKNLFADGDYYEGDLLKSILTVDESFWRENQTLKERLKGILLKEFNAIDDLQLSDEIRENLNALVKIFMDVK